MCKNDNATSQLPQNCLPNIPPSPQAKALDNNFRNAVKGIKRELVRGIYYLRVIYDRKIYRLFGYQNIREYAKEAGGLSDGQCRAFLKIGKKLGHLPKMEQALEDGSLSWRKAETIVDETDTSSEIDLIEVAKRLSCNDLKRAVIKHPTQKPKAQPRPKPPELPVGKLPSLDPIKPADSPCYVTYKFSPEQYSLWAAFNARSGKLSKEEKLLEALKGQTSGKFNSEHSDSGFLIIIHECPRCGLATISNNRGTFHPPKALLESARCDAIIEDEEANRRRVISPRLRRQVLKRDRYRCQASGCQNTHTFKSTTEFPLLKAVHHLRTTS